MIKMFDEVRVISILLVFIYLGIVLSTNFTYSPVQLKFSNISANISTVNIFSGEFFDFILQVQLYDNSSNLVTLDSTSKVKISLYYNPTNAVIGPSNSLFANVLRGTATFSSLKISTPSNHYRFGFTLYKLVDYTWNNSYESTNIILLSNVFKVKVGHPRQLVTVVHGSKAWASGQAMLIQPVIALADYSGNIITNNYNSISTVSMVSSPGTYTKICINTTNAINTITNVEVNVDSGTYGAGLILKFYVIFKFEVWSINFDEILLKTNIYNILTNSYANAEIKSTVIRLKNVTFEYVTQIGDTVTELNYFNENSLTIGLSNSLYDGNNHSIDTTLPLIGIIATKQINLNTFPPNIISLSCNTTSGEYGVGQVIEFAIVFNSTIQVNGNAYLILSVLYDDLVYDSIYANYSHPSNDSQTLYFNYIVDYKHTSNLLSISVNYEYIILYSNSTITQKSDYPLIQANLSFPIEVIYNFTSSYNIVIDTEQISLNSFYGLRSNNIDGIYLPGDVIYLTVQSTKPVISQGVSIELKLNAGSSVKQFASYAIFDSIYSDDKTILFKYVVPNNPLVNASLLDLFDNEFALVIPTDGLTYIRRLSTHPTMDIDSYTANIFKNARSLIRYRSISVTSSKPYIKSIQILKTDSRVATTLHPDDSILISVEFNRPIFVSCSPVLVIHATYEEEAVYFSGNQTNELLFNYTVKVGDESNHLYLRYFPFALCSVSTCPQHSKTYCRIYGLSTIPTLEIDYDIPKFEGSNQHLGILINNSISIQPNLLHRNTSIISIVYNKGTGSYGSGTVLYFFVNFTDIVIVTATNLVYPTLYLNIDQYAQYYGGSNTKTLRFAYIVRSVDNLASLHPTNYSSSYNNTFIKCLSVNKCYIRNRNNKEADLTISKYAKLDKSIIKLDNSSPYIKRVYTNASQNNVYTIGDQIYVFIEFDRAIVVLGVLPVLIFYIGSNTRYAYLTNTSTLLSHTTNTLNFLYQIAEYDYTEELSLHNAYLYLNTNHTYIYLSSESPLIFANTTLPFQEHFQSKNGSNIHISINTLDRPKVLRINIYNTTVKNKYRVGDYIYLEVILSHYVSSSGFPYLHLNCGSNIGIAEYIGYDEISLKNKNIQLLNNSLPIPPTKKLFLLYVVKENDFNNKLDYIDSYSLFPGNDYYNHTGYFIVASESGIDYISIFHSIYNIPNDIIDFPHIIQLSLPYPGDLGSISFSNSLYVDGYAPYLTSISFMNQSGTYSIDEPIYLLLNFSSEVKSTGSITIKLRAGSLDRYAYLVSENDSSINLIFRYDPQIGDSICNLDYYSDSLKYNQANNSIIYNGNKILSDSEHPQQDASVHLNPVRGSLISNSQYNISNGLFYYQDLSITAVGLDYYLDFFTYSSYSDKLIRSYQSIYVTYSNEYELRPSESLYGAKAVGYAVAINDGLVVLGAPATNQSVKSIQSITTSGVLLDPQQEIQRIQIYVNPQPLILYFYTTGDVATTIGGYFSITYGTHGTSRGIPVNASEETINGILNYDLPSLGKISVSLVPYVYCACNNAYNWTLTFNDITEGDFDSFILNGEELTGINAEILGPYIIQSPASISGSFKLKIPNALLESIPIAYNANIYNMSEGLQSIGLSFSDIDIIRSTSTSISWIITFNEYNSSYEVPLLSTDTSNLSGGNISVLTDILRPGIHGPEGLSGYFQLEFRNNITTKLLANITADELKIKLEELPVIGSVNVTRILPSFIGGHTWVIKLVDVKKYTPYGYISDPTDEIETFVALNYLIGTNATITVGNPSVYNRFGDMNQQGTYGSNAGAAYIFQNIDDSWMEVSQIIGNDTSPNDQFGCSVAISGANNLNTKETVVVGAYTAQQISLPVIQQLLCSAFSGGFTISIFGSTTSYISSSTNYNNFINMIANELNGIYDVIISNWGDSGVCDNQNITISFRNVNSVYKYLTITNYNLSSTGDDVVLKLILLQSPLYVTTPEPQGAVYFFQANYDCDSNNSTCVKSNWNQIAKFYPLTSYGYEKFGFSVAISGIVTIVGSPGSRNNIGTVYVYEYSSIDTSASYEWQYLQQLRVPELSSGSGFGYSVAISGNTIIVGAPYSLLNIGSAYVFHRPEIELGLFTEVQVISPSSNSLTYSLQSGDLYGYSVSINDNVVVISSPGRTDDVVYKSTNHVSSQTHCGSVFVFTRLSFLSEFILLQKLSPSNVRAYDNFGWDLSMSDDLIAVGAVQTFTGSLTTFRTVISIVTQASYNGTALLGSFALQWLVTYSISAHTWNTTLITRSIPYDVSASELQSILMNDLNTGKIIVTRSNIDSNDNGYQWLVTFIDLLGEISLFTADYSNLYGTNAEVVISYYVPSSIDLRGNAHVFSLTDSSYYEEVILSPYSYQPIDRCGYSVSVDVKSNNVIIGCPNRDIYISGLNSGAGILYNLDMLDLFILKENFTNEIIEGEDYKIVVKRDYNQLSNDDIYFSIKTIDRNADISTQLRISQLYGLTAGDLIYPLTYMDAAGICGSAIGLAQYYGSSHNESLWVNGMFDYRGINDYVPLDNSFIYNKYNSNITSMIITISDVIYEYPFENITVGLFSPGVWPSPIGRLFSSVTLNDNSTGLFIFQHINHNDSGIYEKIVNSEQLLYTKLYPTNYSIGDQVGSVLKLLDDIGVMFVGIPLANNSSGLVIHYKRNDISNEWVEYNSLFSPIQDSDGNSFGADIALTLHKNNLSISVISEPNICKVHVYISYDSGSTYTHEETLSVDEAYLPQHEFGTSGTIGLDGNLLAVGAPGIEAIFIFKRIFNKSQGNWTWTAGDMFRSSDFDYDIIYTIVSLHTQGFGTSLSVSSRTIAVGSPYADYDKFGTNLVEVDWNTQGDSILSYGRGKVYLFYSSPAIQMINLYSNEQLGAGNFKLIFNNSGINSTTTFIPFNSEPYLIQSVLEQLENLDSIGVSYTYGSQSDYYLYSWVITFLSEWQEPNLFQPIWYGEGCDDCTPFNYTFSKSENKQITVTKVATIGDIFQQQSIKAFDGMNGDRFGACVEISDDQLMIGAPYSASVTLTTWDFEVGVLLGWSKSGDAFDFQPTYGDNSYYREDQSIKNIDHRIHGKSTGFKGLYYIGTYEKHPGSQTDYLLPDSNYNWGSIQGDKPQGTLTSDVFIIYGTKISFLIGGGCNKLLEYIELIVDGFTVARETGQCSERMVKSYFDVTDYYNRAAYIRIVDKSSANWGHINIDQIEFDWDILGATYVNSNEKVSNKGKVETPNAGVVYTYSRYINNTVQPCLYNKSECSFLYEAKLSPSNKRASFQFGSSITINGKSGFVAIGAPGATQLGIYAEIPSVYPFYNSTGYPTAAGITFPIINLNMDVYNALPSFTTISSGAHAVWYSDNITNQLSNTMTSINSGAVYLFTKSKYIESENGTILKQQHWPNIEKARIQAPDGYAYDNFGDSISLSNFNLMIGSPGQDGIAENAGSVYGFNIGFLSLSFQEVEFPVFEGVHAYAAVTILRDPSIYNGDLAINYATSDLSAQGVDFYKFEECLGLAVSKRGLSGCGDYELTQGTMTILSNSYSGGFTVRIMNDLCKEDYSKYIQVSISIPGSGVIIGNDLTALIRIDDDDYNEKLC